MRDIKDGSISGVLPSSNEVFAVHYPGYPSSTERAVDTLGGKDVVVKVRSDKSSKLKLHFRPEDPYSHPAFGELLPCNSYLLKISKRKAASEVKQTNDGVKDELFADIVSRVSEAYHFNGMVDYQHVFAVHADVTRRKKRNLTGIELQLEDIGLLDVNQDDLMILVPPLFSKKGPPEEVLLKTFGDSSLKKKQEEAVHRRCGMEIEQCLAIDFNIKEIPKKVNWEDSIPRNSDQWHLQRVVCQLFDERPIWSKLSLAEHLLDQGIRVVNKVLRRLLFIAAYYFSNGPYLRFWIRKGYDPRKDPESRIYQRTDFRVPPSLRSYCDTNELSGLMCRWQDICAFRVFPRKCQLSLQLFELKDDFIQQEIGKPASQENCTLQTGWFSAHVIEALRLRVAQRFLSIYPETGAESLLKTVRKNFEKSSRPPVNKTDKRVDGEGKQADKDISEIEDKEANDEGEYEEDEEDEMEDYNLEEEMDVDEELDPVNQNGSFSYMDQENMSKDYLQELFGSFPFEMPDDDGGYQIYDQYSDDNFSDDDDF